MFVQGMAYGWEMALCYLIYFSLMVDFVGFPGFEADIEFLLLHRHQTMKRSILLSGLKTSAHVHIAFQSCMIDHNVTDPKWLLLLLVTMNRSIKHAPDPAVHPRR